MVRTKYRGVTLPTDLIEQIKRVIDEDNWGYVSIAEFIKDATRQHLFRLRNNYQPKGGDE